MTYNIFIDTKNITHKTLEIKLPSTSKCLVVSDIHLGANTTSASRRVEKLISDRLEEFAKYEHTAIVLNGDIFELWGGKDPSVEKALSAHPKLAAALKVFGKDPSHHVLFVVGNHDSELAWNTKAQQYLHKNFSAEISLSLSVQFGVKKVVFEHGHQLDPDNAIHDPYNKYEKPFGQYIVQEALPLVAKTQGKLLAGINHLSEPLEFAKFTAARIVYREVVNRLWWLLVPIVAVFALAILGAFGISVLADFSLEQALRFVLFGEILFVVNFVLVFTVMAVIFRRLLSRAKTMPQKKEGEHSNTLPQEYAGGLHESDKSVVGYITGHTHKPAIVDSKTYFYANSGCGVETLTAVPTYAKLPKPFVSFNKVSWLELISSETDLKVRLYREQVDNQRLTRLEKLVAKPIKIAVPLDLDKQIVFDIAQ